jgi:hypothetical protein
MILGILHLATLKKRLGNISIGNGKKYKDQLTAKEWQDLIDFEGNANGFTVLTGSGQESREVFGSLLLLWEHL